MAGEKSGDNRLYQILTLILTTIVAPITVWLVTNTLKTGISQPAPTAIPAAIATSIPDIRAEVSGVLQSGAAPAQPTHTQVVQETAVFASAAAPTAVPPTALSLVSPTPTSFGIINPSGTIPAGQPAVVGDLALVVVREDIATEGDQLRLTLHLLNLGDSRQKLVYSVETITIKDDTGKVYKPYLGENRSACKSKDLAKERKLEIEPGAEITLHPADSENLAGWCAKNAVDILPVYTRPVDGSARSIVIEVNGLGPMRGFAIQVPLK